MSEPPTHYEILGVSRTATAQEIRAAYLRLMKRYHPDTSPGAGRAAALVPALNRSYAILKNAATRSQYDRAIGGFSQAVIPPVRDRPAAPQARHRWVAVLLASVFALGILLLSLEPTLQQDTQALVTRAGGWITGSEPSSRPTATAQSDAANSRRMARLARTLSIPQAEQFSRSCFALAARQPRPGQGDGCVMFDVAFLYWQKVPGFPVLPAYFADGVADSRHRDATADYGRAGESRLHHLRQLAFRGLMHSLEEGRATRRRATPLPATSPEQREIRDAERRRLAQTGS